MKSASRPRPVLLLSFLLTAGAAPADLPALPRQTPGASELARWADDVEIVRTRAGTPILRLKARSSKTDVQGRTELSEVTLRLYGADGTETVVEAPRARSLPGAEAPPTDGGAVPGRKGSSAATVGSWVLEGGVTIRTVSGLVAVMETLALIEPEGAARTRDTVSFSRGDLRGESAGLLYELGSRSLRFPGRFKATMGATGMGRVTLDAASGSCEIAGDLFEALEYTVLTEHAERLSGSRLKARMDSGGSRLSRIEGESGFSLTSEHAAPARGGESILGRLLALEGRRDLRGDRITIGFAGGVPASVEVNGAANLSATPEAAGGSPTSLAAETLLIDLEEGSVSRVRARGEVDLRGRPVSPGDPGFHLNSDQLEATLDPSRGSLLKVEGAGGIRLTDRELESEGTRTTLDPNTDIITLTGESDRPAVATLQGRRIEALQRIEVDRRRQTLSAAGGVRASYQPQPPAGPGSSRDPGVPFFDGESTIYVMAGRLTLAEQGAVAHYREHVRLWQGESRLEASEVDVLEREGRLEARGSVTSAFRPGNAPVPANAAIARQETITVAAESMRFDRNAHLVTYAGGVQVIRGTTRITAREMRVLLAEDGSRAESLEATGNVQLRDPGRLGVGDRLTLDLKTETTVLIGAGREAMVQDEAGQQVVRGRSLTMERTGDRILVESERAGRSWITLKPRQKGAPGVDAKPRN